MLIWAQDYENFEQSINNLFDLNKTQKAITDIERQKIQKILYGDRLDNPFKEILKYGEHMQEIEFDEDQEDAL